MPSRSSSAARYPPAKEPSPPAFDTAATSSGVEGPPAMGAWMMGSSIPTRPAIPLGQRMRGR